MAVTENLQVKARRVGTEVYDRAVTAGLSSDDYDKNVVYRAKKAGEVLGTTSGNTKPGYAGDFLQIVVAVPENPFSPYTTNFEYYYYWVDSTDVDLVTIPKKQPPREAEPEVPEGEAETVVLEGDGSVPGDTEIVVYKNTELGASQGEVITIRAERAAVATKSPLPGWVKWVAFGLLGLGAIGLAVAVVLGRKNQADDDFQRRPTPRKK